MLRWFKFTLLGLLLSGCISAYSQDIIACGDDKVFIIDGEKSTNENPVVTWKWSVSEVKDLPEVYQKYLIPFDDCKPVRDNRQLLLTSSGGGVVLLDRASKQSLFYAYAPMAHSAELLPGNRIVVALSTHPKGNSIELYNIDQPEKVIFKDSLYSGHGVVWMPEYERLFALGYDVLRSYSLKDWDGANPYLEMEKSWSLPDEGGHDLMRISDKELIVSSHKGTFIFNIEDGRFRSFKPLADVPNVKSVNYNPKTKRLIYTKAEESWWTYHIYGEHPKRLYTFPEIKLYKVRVYPE